MKKTKKRNKTTICPGDIRGTHKLPTLHIAGNKSPVAGMKPPPREWTIGRRSGIDARGPVAKTAVVVDHRLGEQQQFCLVFLVDNGWCHFVPKKKKTQRMSLLMLTILLLLILLSTILFQSTTLFLSTMLLLITILHLSTVSLPPTTMPQLTMPLLPTMSLLPTMCARRWHVIQACARGGGVRGSKGVNVTTPRTPHKHPTNTPRT